MRMRESKIVRRELGRHRHDPVTGVGNPGPHPEAAGASLGGDTGDVGTPRIPLGDSPGGTRGTHEWPESSSVVSPSERAALRGRRQK